MRSIIHFISLLLGCFFSYFNAFGQTPNNDPHWLLNFSEKFNSIDPSIYNLMTSQENGYKFEPSNVSINSGELNLIASNGVGQFYTGGISTLGKKEFSYGYFEIDGQFPIGPNRAGYWCVFWLHKGSCHNYAEIDIWEPNGVDAVANNKYHCGLFGTSGSTAAITPCSQCDPSVPDCSCEEANCKGKAIFNPPVVSLTSMNKYAVEWTPQSCIYYRNDQPLDFALYPTSDPSVFIPGYQGNAKVIPSRPQELYLTFQIDNYVTPSTTFPAILKFDNFNYYSLKLDCTSPLVRNNFNFSTHDYKVKKYISIVNSTVPINSKIFLRAVEYIQFGNNFEVPLGSELTVITHYGFCPE